MAVCDPEPPPERHPDTQENERPEYDGERLIEPQLAATLAQQSLERVGLTERDNWRLALDDTTDGDPVLVQRLDHSDSFYWIVPRVRAGAATVVVNIDARFGQYLQARALPEPQGTALLLLNRQEAEEIIYGRLHQLPGRLGEVRVRPGLACISDQWVWRPCRESLSPFYPFKLVSYGAHRLYVRSDGRVFSRLTTSDRGDLMLGRSHRAVRSSYAGRRSGYRRCPRPSCCRGR